MFRSIGTLVLALIALVAMYTYRTQLYVFAFQAYSQVLPCSRPLPYAIGTVDKRFSISRDELRADIERAVGIWNAAASTTLFVYDPVHPVLTVNLTYDARQQTTQKLQEISSSAADKSTTYDETKAKYMSGYASYQRDLAAFNTAYTSYQSAVSAYMQEVQASNARGGATPATVARLNATAASLQQRQAALAEQQANLDAKASAVNALVEQLKSIAGQLDVDAQTYHTVGSAIGERFEEGLFSSLAGHEQIDVYEYDTKTRLVRLLAHEFGHAIGLDHVNDPDAIMYKLNQADNVKPTADDIAEMKRACRM